MSRFDRKYLHGWKQIIAVNHSSLFQRGLLQYSLVIFVISTTGQGDLPKNAREFWKSLLRKRLAPNCLSQVRFTTFGLGDSSYFQCVPLSSLCTTVLPVVVTDIDQYPHRYNWAARKLHKRLEQLGAIEFLPRGEADERHEDGYVVKPTPFTVEAA